MVKNPVDGQVITDSSGTMLRYHADINAWISTGAVLNTQLVTIKDAGLVFPELAAQLDKLSNVPTFKIFQNPDAYYYIIIGARGFYNTSVEGNNVRVELNRGTITRTLFMKACQGERGPKGYDGVAGANGLPGPNEISFAVVVEGAKLSFVAPVAAPLDTQVSIRLYVNQSLSLEIWYDPFDQGTNVWELVSNISGIGIMSAEFGYADGDLSVSLTGDKEWGSGWSAKARQRGPVGWVGVEGESFLEVTESVLYSITSSQFTMSLRKASDDTLYMATQTLGEMPAFHLRPVSIQNFNSTFLSTDTVASVEPSVDNSKLLRKWLLPASDDKADPLVLPIWTPDPSCLRQGFNGVGLDTPTDEFDWHSQFTGDQALPVNIESPGMIPKRCCQEDFYFCPNLNEGVCDPNLTPAAAPVTTFYFSQDTPAATWEIIHNAGKRPTDVVAHDMDGNIIIGDISNPDVNTTIITFSSAIAGRAVLSFL